jgi:hypothetical protein
MVDGRDQTDRFIHEAIWEHCFDDDHSAAQVRSMRTGESFEQISEAGCICSLQPLESFTTRPQAF